MNSKCVADALFIMCRAQMIRGNGFDVRLRPSTLSDLRFLLVLSKAYYKKSAVRLHYYASSLPPLRSQSPTCSNLKVGARSGASL